MQSTPGTILADRGSLLLPLLSSTLTFGVPVDLLATYLALHIHDSPLQILFLDLIAPIVGVLFGWTQATNPPRCVEASPEGAAFTMQDLRVLRVPWEDFVSAEVLGPPIWTVRIKADDLPTLYSLVFLTYSQARALLSYPAFPELYHLHEARSRLGIRT